MIPNQPPDDFCKFLFMDPGTTRSAALFVAVPGPADDDDPTRYRPRYVHFYDELMLYNATASEFAREVKKREGTTQFYDFVMDQRAGRQHPMGFDITVFEQYQQAFSKVDLVSMRGGPFEPGSDDVDGRELLLKQWMRDGTVVVAPHLVNLKKQMEDFFKKKTDPTKRELRGVTELIHCAEYCAAYFENGLFWVNPVKLDKLDEKDECTEILKDLKASNWNMRESLLRARIRHDQEQLIECVVSTEGEFPGEPGDQQWWPKDQAVPAGWDVVDKNDHTRSQKYAALDYLRQRRQGHVVF